jgi:uncharacterized protein YyaL (SSP411 family)
MLYDNAQLARVYLHAWQVTGNDFFRIITQEILDYVMREMTGPEGGFYSTQDADSEGEEGKFFLWTPDEIRQVLGDAAEPFLLAYGVSNEGNFEGKNILEYTGLLAERDKFIDDRLKLFQARQRRVAPGRDEKVLTSWNGLMLAALGHEDYRRVAEQNADFLLHHLMTDEGRLRHTWKAGGRPEAGNSGNGHCPETQAEGPGFLEDYACLIEGLLALYQVEFDPRWYQAAHDLAETMITHFRAPEGGFYDTADDHEDLIVRPRDVQDNATPSGNAMAATALLKLAGLAAAPRYVEIAREALAGVQGFLERYPLGFGQWLVALDYALSRPFEIAIVGPLDDAATQRLLDAATDGFRPHQVVACGPAGQEAAAVPLLAGRDLVNGKPAAYACRDFACQAPVTSQQALEELLSVY